MKKKRRILVVDDERDLCDILQVNLEAQGYEVDTALSAVDALRMEIEHYDLLLLDVMMNGMSGFDLARMLRNAPATARLPIIFLTALDGEDHVLKGFDLGADDYIAKPFSLREVSARVKAVLARTEGTTDVIVFEGLRLDSTARVVSVDGQYVPVTPIEFGILQLLIGHSGQVYSRQQLIEQVWPHGTVVTDRTVDVNITRLRKKLGRYAACVATRVGFGYYFNRHEKVD